MTPVDAEQLAILWTKAQPKLAAYISSLVRDYHAADDILQNVAAVVVCKRDTYDPELPFVPWAIRIAKFEVLKHQRGTARDRLRFDPELVEEITASYEEESDGLDLRREALAECVNKVDGRAREALLLRYAKNLMPAEIAARLQIKANAVNVMLHRTRQALHDCIERYVRREDSIL